MHMMICGWLLALSPAAWSQSTTPDPALGDQLAPQQGQPSAPAGTVPTPPGTEDGGTALQPLTDVEIPDGLAQGVVVRLETEGAAVPTSAMVRLTPGGSGDPVEYVLLDDGAPPDVSAGDGSWSAGGEASADAYTVTLIIDGKTYEGGVATWSAGGARDLVLRLEDDTLSMEATVSAAQGGTPGAGPAAAAAGGAGAATGLPPLGNGASTGPAAAGNDATNTASALGSGWLWALLGLGLLGLVGGVVLLVRTTRSEESNGIDLPRAPEPAILGGPTPSMSDGVSVWLAPPASQEAVVQGIAGAMARDHRLLLVLPPGTKAPPLFGGPVYVCHETEMQKVEDYLDRIYEDDGPALTAMMVLAEPTAARIEAFAAAVEPELGGIVVVTEAVETKRIQVRVEPQDEAFVLHCAGGSTKVVKSQAGFRSTESA